MKLVAFEDAVIESEVHILVLDPHFDAIGFNVLEAAISISQARDVRLLTGRGDIDKNERELLRDRFKTPLSCESPQYEMDHSNVDKRFTVSG